MIYKKSFKPPPPTIDIDTFKSLLQKRGVACVKACIEEVELQQHRQKQQRRGKRQRVGNGKAANTPFSASSDDGSDGASSSTSADREDANAAGLATIQQRLRTQQQEARAAKQQELQHLLTRQADAAHQLEALERRLSDVQEQRARLMQQIKQALKHQDSRKQALATAAPTPGADLLSPAGSWGAAQGALHIGVYAPLAAQTGAPTRAAPGLPSGDGGGELAGGVVTSSTVSSAAGQHAAAMHHNTEATDVLEEGEMAS